MKDHTVYQRERVDQLASERRTRRTLTSDFVGDRRADFDRAKGPGGKFVAEETRVRETLLRAQISEIHRALHRTRVAQPPGQHEGMVGRDAHHVERTCVQRVRESGGRSLSEKDVISADGNGDVAK